MAEKLLHLTCSLTTEKEAPGPEDTEQELKHYLNGSVEKEGGVQETSCLLQLHRLEPFLEAKAEPASRNEDVSATEAIDSLCRSLKHWQSLSTSQSCKRLSLMNTRLSGEAFA